MKECHVPFHNVLQNHLETWIERKMWQEVTVA